MPRGGSRPGERRGGRRKGSRNKRSKALDEAQGQAAALIEGVIPGAFPGNAHALLMAVYKNPEIPLHVRVDAAKAAIAYETPRLERRDLNHGVTNPVAELLAELIGRARVFRPVGDGTATGIAGTHGPALLPNS
jgi:hypothetical protein